MAADQTVSGATTASQNAAPKNSDVEIRIKQATNGVVVEGCYRGSGPYLEKEYVFKTLEDAFAEIPSIMSVVQTEGKEKAASMKNKSNQSDCVECD